MSSLMTSLAYKAQINVYNNWAGSFYEDNEENAATPSDITEPAVLLLLLLFDLILCLYTALEQAQTRRRTGEMRHTGSGMETRTYSNSTSYHDSDLKKNHSNIFCWKAGSDILMHHLYVQTQ
ncbi:hypothetical protein VTO58DRAFT_110131 [Aureobasidium pullulans]